MAEIEFQHQRVYQLRDGDSQALIAPGFGARLLRWSVGEQPIIYWPENADWSSIDSIAHTRGGNPILFPFLGRHYVDGELAKWRDESGVVRDLPMHGFARDLPFEVIDADAGVLRMRLEATDQTRMMYPFEFRFDVVYSLRGSTLEATFETSNFGSTPLPYYAGHHFYFSIPHDQRKDWKIELPCRTWGRQNPDGTPQLEPASSTHSTLADEKLIDRFHLDFFGPRVSLRSEKARRKIEVEWDAAQTNLWHDVTTWTQAPESDFYCVEPWLGLPDAIHHGNGLRHVAPDETEIATCRIVADSI